VFGIGLGRTGKKINEQANVNSEIISLNKLGMFLTSFILIQFILTVFYE